MGNLSVRLGEEIERNLDREAEISGKNRSDVVREAVGEYLTRKERDRFIAELAEEMRRAYSDPQIRREMQEIQEDFDAADNSIDFLEAEERAAGIDPDEKWWE